MSVVRIDRITRIKMLLTSYLDARPAPTSNTSERTTGSRERSRPQMPYLWWEGSYADLEEALSAVSLSSRHRLWRGFIDQPDRRRRIVQRAYQGVHAKELAWDLKQVSKRMPEYIRVPRDIEENWADYVAEPDNKRR